MVGLAPAAWARAFRCCASVRIEVLRLWSVLTFREMCASAVGFRRRRLPQSGAGASQEAFVCAAHDAIGYWH